MSDENTPEDEPEIDLGEAQPAAKPDEFSQLVEEAAGFEDSTLDPGPDPEPPEQGGIQAAGGQNPFHDSELENPTIADDVTASTVGDLLMGAAENAGEAAAAAKWLEHAKAADADFAEEQLPESVIPQLSDDGVVDPWGRQQMPDDDQEIGDAELPSTHGEELGDAKPVVSVPGILGVMGVLVVVVGLAIWFLGQGDDEPALGSDDTTSVTEADSETEPGAEAETETGADAQTWVATDAAEWEQFDEFDEIIREREADGIIAGEVMDATSMVSAYVTSNGKSAEVGITFAGDAQAAQAHDRVDLSGGVGWTTADGRYLDILFYDDGTYKISDKPSDRTIEALWEQPDKLVFFVDGVGVVPGEAVALSLFLEVFGGVNLQTAEIPTG